MKRTVIYFFIYLLSIISLIQGQNKRMSRYGFEINSRPNIYYNVFISYFNGPKLIFSLDIQNDILQFEKKEDIYKAKYDISINLKDFDEEQTLFTENWAELIDLDEFKKTNSKMQYQSSKKTFDINLKSGKYKLFVELSDVQTGNNYYSKRTIEINRQQDGVIRHSNLVFMENEPNNMESINISSSRNIVEFNQSPLVMFEYETQIEDSIKVLSKLFRYEDQENKNLIHEQIYSEKPQTGYNYFVQKLDNSNLLEGEYILEYEITQAGNEFALKDTFKVIWFEKPTYMYKYDLALRPMQYLLPAEEYEKVESFSIEELKNWFNEFWKKQDKTPDTPFNEIQFEFYTRVEKSIRQFSLRFKEGWKTERGETLILYGEPDRKEKHHHVTGSKPYEIWYYDNLNKKITFMDTHKNEDFKIVSIENLEE